MAEQTYALSQSGVYGLANGAYADALSAIPDSVDNQWPLDEGSGTTQTDNVGSIDATMNGSTWVFDADAVGDYVVSYDGADDYDELASNPRYVYNGDFTITAYIVIDDASANLTIFGDQDGDNAEGFRFRVNSGNLGWVIEGVESASHSTSLSTGTVYFASARWDDSAGEITLGIDGSYETYSVSAPAAPTSDNARWGQPGARSDFHFAGDMDERTMAASYLSDSDLDTLQSRRNDF